ncbi:HAD family hydrolase [Paraliobacillus ryukyuensis]|uniref:HAD family hydrolase n=1 Tax=Paraliobacillus ryukyuensis TaxID=200904 RepID=UPI0009A5F992|nr:HAD family hydrolase [Paraliobacillus ryukyuensis]
MRNYKALFLDIDGTILLPSHTIQPSTIEAVKQVKTKGIEVFLATGRPLHEIDWIAKVLDVHSYIGYNGAYASIKNDVIVNKAIPKQVVDHYYHVSKKLGHEMVLYTADKNLFTSLQAKMVQDFIGYFDLKKNDLFEPNRTQAILGITIMGATREDLKLYETKEPIYFSQVNVEGLTDNYDVIRKNVNKGSAIQQVLESLSIPTESAIAFGDGMNDKQMLQVVGESFAMGNAHPELFDFAKHRTTSVVEDGIFNGLKSLSIIP